METNLPQALSALSVLFAVAVFHLGSNSTKVNEALAIEASPFEQKLENEKKRREIFKVILFSALPSFLMLSAICFVMTPLAIEHLVSTEMALWDFDFMISLYQMIWLIVVFYFIVSAVNVSRLCRKLSSFKRRT